MTMGNDRVEVLKEQIAKLKKRWSAYSLPPAMMEQLDALVRELYRTGVLIKDIETDAQVIHVRAIGHVENEFDEPTAPDKIRSVESCIVIEPTLIEGLKSLETNQQIMVVFYFHRSEGFDLLQHPRGDPNRPNRGVFALRSPNRPNPIGVTVVDLLGIEDNVLRVRGLDAINRTPVLDLKPA
jgi:tRNA-Thr(GGU) m(6)t(6)A37 methyltransferase TsaA